LGPEHLERWKLARLQPRALPKILVHTDFEEALDILTCWRAPRNAQVTGSRTDELLGLLSAGLNMDELRRLLAMGYDGHEIVQWRRSRVPVEGWGGWIAQNVAPAVASAYFDNGVAPTTARQWIDTGIPDQFVFDFVDLGVEPPEAHEFVRNGVWPWMLRRTANGVEVIDFDAERRQHALEQLPEVVEPGRISFTRWSTVGEGDAVAYDFSFTWDGKREAEWDEDISLSNGSLSPASSAPIWGTAAWPNGRDVELTYDWPDVGKEGETVLVGAAPTSSDPDSDQGTRDPEQWIRLADELLEFIFSGID
jgi:hypothetical protein